MKQEVGKHELEITMLETLLHKLEVITSGPSLRKLGREVENAAGDLKALLKDIKNIWQKTQASVGFHLWNLFEFILIFIKISRNLILRYRKYRYIWCKLVSLIFVSKNIEVFFKRDIQKQFSRKKEEAQNLLDLAKETAENLKRSDGISVTKEVLLKSKHFKILKNLT